MTDPFRYFPHPLVQQAADEVIQRISGSETLSEAFAEGKMLGVLVTCESPLEYLAAFSGNVGGKSIIEGFVPPIFDLLDPEGHFKSKESEITALNCRIRELEESQELMRLREELSSSEQKRDEEILSFKALMAVSKRERNEIRNETTDPSTLSLLIRKSQHEKAELKRLKASWEEKTCRLQQDIDLIVNEIKILKKKRASMSDGLQKWIFRQYVVHNAAGEERSIYDIFDMEYLIPPGGTGECAAPKLLEYAYRHGLKPVAMGEFWYGASPDTAVRTHGHFYPSCTSKCGPLLGFMMKGLDMEFHPENPGPPEIIFEDDFIIVAAKPSGMPSVPGLDGRKSIQECFEDKTIAVHRLDMDTSGLIIFAKDRITAYGLHLQFENREILKTYVARIAGNQEGKHLKAGDKGTVELPLSPDYDERPRQKVDYETGKPSLTEYEVIRENPDGTFDIIFHPHTGRTHQLRVHSAHILGLGHPMVGDMLYGGSAASRLHLHAAGIRFTHPMTGETMEFSSVSHMF